MALSSLSFVFFKSGRLPMFSACETVSGSSHLAVSGMSSVRPPDTMESTPNMKAGRPDQIEIWGVKIRNALEFGKVISISLKYELTRQSKNCFSI